MKVHYPSFSKCEGNFTKPADVFLQTSRKKRRQAKLPDALLNLTIYFPRRINIHPR